jgi:hypothetical protein
MDGTDMPIPEEAMEIIQRLKDENAELKAEIDRLKRPKGFHDVSDLYREVSHE